MLHYIYAVSLLKKGGGYYQTLATTTKYVFNIGSCGEGEGNFLIKEVMMLNKNYLITGVDPDLYKKFKAACAYFGLSMKDILIKHMRNIVSDYMSAKGMFGKPKIYTDKGVKKK